MSRPGPERPLATRRAALGIAAGAAAALAAIPDAAASGWRRGINLSWWLHLDGRFRPTDGNLRQVRDAGFDHVRLPFDPYLFGWRLGEGGLAAPGTAQLAAAVDAVLRAGLGVILDLHPGDELVALLHEARAPADAIAELWGGLAGSMAGLDPDKVAFEVANEPHRFLRGGRAALAELHRKALAAIRARAAAHRVLAMGLWDPESSLRTLTILPDDRVIYAFHLYDPYVVTHQGADWGEPDAAAVFGPLRRVPWPATRLLDPERHVADPARDRAAVRALRDYRNGRDHCGRQEDSGPGVLARKAAAAAAWGARHGGVPVHCTEFGVLRTYADDVVRRAWLGDARAALEARGIGWTVWDYAGSFGVTTGCRDGFGSCGALDPGILAALGLRA
jgi:endoglucanase